MYVHIYDPTEKLRRTKRGRQTSAACKAAQAARAAAKRARTENDADTSVAVRSLRSPRTSAALSVQMAQPSADVFASRQALHYHSQVVQRDILRRCHGSTARLQPLLSSLLRDDGPLCSLLPPLWQKCVRDLLSSVQSASLDEQIVNRVRAFLAQYKNTQQSDSVREAVQLVLDAVVSDPLSEQRLLKPVAQRLHVKPSALRKAEQRQAMGVFTVPRAERSDRIDAVTREFVRTFWCEHTEASANKRNVCRLRIGRKQYEQHSTHWQKETNAVLYDQYKNAAAAAGVRVVSMTLFAQLKPFFICPIGQYTCMCQTCSAWIDIAPAFRLLLLDVYAIPASSDPSEQCDCRLCAFVCGNAMTSTIGNVLHSYTQDELADVCLCRSAELPLLCADGECPKCGWENTVSACLRLQHLLSLERQAAQPLQSQLQPPPPTQPQPQPQPQPPQQPPQPQPDSEPQSQPQAQHEREWTEWRMQPKEHSEEQSDSCKKRTQKERTQQRGTADQLLAAVSLVLTQFIAHRFLVRHQEEVFRAALADMPADTVLLVPDFSQNILHKHQYEVQAEYFAQQHTSLLPLVLFFKQGQQVAAHSFFFLSDDKVHDSAFAQCAIVESLQWTREKLPNVRHVRLKV